MTSKIMKYLYLPMSNYDMYELCSCVVLQNISKNPFHILSPRHCSQVQMPKTNYQDKVVAL